MEEEEMEVLIGVGMGETLGSFVQRVNDPLTSEFTPNNNELPDQFSTSSIAKKTKK